MSRDEAIDGACASIAEVRIGRAVTVVAIDGGCGAGKSTLAAGICNRLGRVSVVSADHFYRPLKEHLTTRLPPVEAYRLYFDWERMRDEAVIPLHRGQSARYQRHDWATDRPTEWMVVEPNEIVVVEGVYTMRPELRPLIDVAVFIETPRDERLRRMLARGYTGNDWLAPWMSAEDWYFANVRPSKHANLVVAGV